MNSDIVTMRENVIKRSRQIRRERTRRIHSAMGGVCTVVIVLLLNVLGVVNNSEILQTGGLFYGTLMLAPQTGGYVLVGVICFVVGAASAVLVVRNNRKKSREDI